jgi:SAM-dependent methyltransferase
MSSSDEANKAVEHALKLYRQGRWRAPLFCDLVLADVKKYCGEARVLDVGCGGGFDGSDALQYNISLESRFYCGVEPDKNIDQSRCFHDFYGCGLEEAPITEASFDVAYSAFVLEHLNEPQIFWDKLHCVLSPGGVFWGFTMDRRHYFSWASMLLQFVRLKNTWLRIVQGNQHYENYPTFYRCNSPQALYKCGRKFTKIDCWTWNRAGQLDAYIPLPLRPVSRFIDRVEMSLNLPGSLLLVRAVR